MSIFGRVNEILTANVNDLVDRFEDPEKMLRQVVREMDEAIASATAAAARSIAGEKLLTKEIERHQAEATRWQTRAGAAVAAGNDAAARRALVRRYEHQRLIEALDDERESTEAVSARLRQRIDAMKVKRAEAARLLMVLAARQSVAETCRLFRAPRAGTVATTAFDWVERLRRRVEFAEAETEALIELAGNEGDDWPFAREVEAAAIEAELLALKGEASGES